MPPQTQRYIPLSERGVVPKPYSAGSGSIDDIMKGLSHVESGGRYDALGKVNPTTGDRAYGKYQAMGAYIPEWSKQYLGRELTPEQYLADPKAQEDMMRARATELYNKYGNADDVASVHFTGRPVAKAGLSVADYTGTTNEAYLNKFHEGMGQVGSSLKKYIPIAERGAQNLISQGQEMFGNYVNDLAHPKTGYIPLADRANQMTRAIPVPEIDPTGMMGLTEKVGTKVAKPVIDSAFKGFTDLSTKLLEKLKGRTTVSREFIENLTNQPDLKQAERDLIRRVLGEGDKAPEYGMSHRPTEGPRAFDLTEKVNGEEMIPKDMYDRWYGSRGTAADKESIAALKAVRGNPEATVTIYRASPEGTFNTGDWVSLSKKYAEEHAAGNGTKVHSQVVKAKDLRWAADDINEFGYYPDKASQQISVPDFANKVKSELLPLTRMEPGKLEGRSMGSRYESVNLPEELRGPVANYSEHIYNSPIKTSAGDVHFSGNTASPNYFAHTRIEDLPPESYKAGEFAPAPGTKGGTRRVIEIQSDLFQKGRLEGEGTLSGYDLSRPRFESVMTPEDLEKYRAAYSINAMEGGSGSAIKQTARETIDRLETKYRPVLEAPRKAEVSKLEPYRNTWHERIIREEVKQAAKDSKTKLQFPTGETAMKIEGLGERNNWNLVTPDFADLRKLQPADLKIGVEVADGSTPWIITDVLGDGKFKAVPKETAEKFKNGKIPKALYETGQETFDISGKVDTENPIYKFYEKTVQKYLTNKYGGKVITDPQGVKWVEIDVKPEMKGLPIEAFGAIGAVGLGAMSNQQNQANSTPMYSDNISI